MLRAGDVGPTQLSWLVGKIFDNVVTSASNRRTTLVAVRHNTGAWNCILRSFADCSARPIAISSTASMAHAYNHIGMLLEIGVPVRVSAL